MQDIIDQCKERNHKPSSCRIRCLTLTNLELDDFVKLREFLEYKAGWEYVMQREYDEFWKYVKAYRNKKISANDLVTRHGKFKAKMIIDSSI